MSKSDRKAGGAYTYMEFLMELIVRGVMKLQLEGEYILLVVVCSLGCTEY